MQTTSAVSVILAALRALLCFSCLLLPPLHASAQADAATVEELMRRSGLWEQLANVAPQVRAGVLAGMSQAGARISETETERLGRAVDAAYDAAKLRTAVMTSLRKGLDAKHLPALRRWYSSPTGKTVTALEEAASADQGDPQALLAEGAKRLDEGPVARRELLNELVTVTHAAESMVQMTINVSLATQRGASSATPNLPLPNQAELRRQLEAQRTPMLQAYTGMALASSARTYATLPTATLAQYVTFLKSNAGRHFNDLGLKAIDAAMVDASVDFGRRLPASKDQSNT